MNNLEKYMDEHGMITPGGMNTIVYTVQYLMLGGLDLKVSFLDILVRHIDDKTGDWCNSDETTPISHDNMTALAICINRYGLQRLRFEPQHAYWHPRDFIYYAFMSNSIFWRLFGNLFLWISSICMIFGVAFDHYKNIDGARILATDGKLLTWMRLYGNNNLYLTKKVIELIMKLRNKRWNDYFLVYFRDPNHPNVILSRNI